MKKKKLIKTLLQVPLRFHHQDIHEELEAVNLMLGRILSKLSDIEEKLNE